MNKRGISPGRLGVMVLFTLSCFGLLLFLWLSFGGSIPLQPEGYRVTILVPDGTGLAVAGDVRVSGVPIGRIVQLDEGPQTTKAVLQIRSRYAPLPDDVRAAVRRKTLLGEAFIEMTPGSKTAKRLADGATLPRARVQGGVAIDQIFSTFDKPTRLDLQRWLQGWGASLRDRAPDINAVVGHLAPTLDATDGLLTILNRQQGALRRLVRDGGRTFAAIGDRDARVQELITAGDTVLRTTADRNAELEATFRALPPFLRELRGSLAAAQRLAVPGTPALTALQPAARVLPSTLDDAVAISPQLQLLARRLTPVVRAAPAGLAAARATINAVGPLMGPLRTFARAAVPATDFINTYRKEIVSSWGKVTYAVQPRYYNPGTNTYLHYLRAPIVFSIEGLLGATQRAPYSRNNAYSRPGGYFEDFGKEPLKAFSCQNLSNPEQVPAFPPGSAPPCLVQQAPTFRGHTGAYPQLVPAP